VVEAGLRLAEVIYAPFYALFLVGPAALCVEQLLRARSRTAGSPSAIAPARTVR
jgi:hypothetical protein